MRFRKMSNNTRTAILLGSIAIAMLLTVATLATRNLPATADVPQPPKTVSMDQIAKMAKDGEVQVLTVNGDQLTAKLADGTTVTSRKEVLVSVVQTLRTYGVTEDQLQGIQLDVLDSGSTQGGGGNTVMMIVSVLAVLFIVAMILANTRNSGAGRYGGFTKSGAKMFSKPAPEQQTVTPSVTFQQVAGCEESKVELQEVVEFLKYPDKFTALGATIPKGVLLVGPPGTGKTLMAKAVAGEAGVPFFSVSGSEFVEMFVGVGASRVRDLFKRARQAAPCIVFIDEIDAVGRHRGGGMRGGHGGHEEREQTLNQILVEMDGFDGRAGVVVIAATNRPDVLDQALLRPGRFDRQVTLDSPDVRGRKAILGVHSKNKPLSKEISLEIIARQTPGFSGADLANLMNEAAILAARHDHTEIMRKDLDEAVDRIIAGPSHKSRVISERERKITAYHELGHALVATVLPNCDPVHKVTIIGRGRAGGYTQFIPAEDRSLWTRSQFMDTLASILGGHAAEELVFGEVTTGASNDIERATDLAQRMVCQYGMSEKFGPMSLGRTDPGYSGRDSFEQGVFSDYVSREIDSEIRALIDESRTTAKQLLAENRMKLEELTAVLLEQETITGEDFKKLLAAPCSKEIRIPEPANAAAAFGAEAAASTDHQSMSARLAKRLRFRPNAVLRGLTPKPLMKKPVPDGASASMRSHERHNNLDMA